MLVRSKYLSFSAMALMIVISACENQQQSKPQTQTVAANGCTPISDPNPPEADASGNKVLIGVGIGAIVGAAAGAVIGGGSKRRNMLIGAGVGALAGGGIGHYMDKQEKELKKELDDSDVGVTRVGDRIVLDMPNQVTFDVDKSDVKQNFYPVLEDISMVLRKYEKTYVDVIGHTDSTGSAQYNEGLSVRRAQSVTNILVSNCVQRGRIGVAGAGEEQPVASNATAAGRTQNRRVEIILSPVT